MSCREPPCRNARAWRQSFHRAGVSTDANSQTGVNRRFALMHAGGNGHLPDLLRHTRNLQRTLDFANNNIGIPWRPGDVDDDQVMLSCWVTEAVCQRCRARGVDRSYPLRRNVCSGVFRVPSHAKKNDHRRELHPHHQTDRRRQPTVDRAILHLLNVNSKQ